jgi:Fur family ferric uptake transcriptional regulator
MQLEQLCLQHGIRLTEHRRIVVEILEAATDHPCVREIHRRAACDHRIGVATVYRTLNKLAAAGLVTRHVFRDGQSGSMRARYECTGAAPHHHHLIDVDTGQVVEVDDAELTHLVVAAARSLGYRLIDYRLMLFGEVARGAVTLSGSACRRPSRADGRPGRCAG